MEVNVFITNLAVDFKNVKIMRVNYFKTIYSTDKVEVELSELLKKFNDTSLKNKAKKDLPLFNISAIFDSKGIKKKNVVGYTGFVGVDIDAKDNEGKDVLKIIQDAINVGSLSYLTFKIPTFSKGARLVIELTASTLALLQEGKVKFNDVAASVIADIEAKTGLVADKSCKDETRRFFINYTTDIYINENATKFDYKPVETIIEKKQPKRPKKEVDKVNKVKTTTERKFRTDIDVEKVKLPTGVQYEGRYYLNVLPRGVFFTPKTTKTTFGVKHEVRGKIKEGNRNNTLCRYLLNQIAYNVYLNEKLTYEALLEQANYFNRTFIEKPLSNDQVKSTVKSMYNSYLEGVYTKSYLVEVFGVRYAKETESYSEFLYKKKVSKFLRVLKHYKNVPTYKEIAIKLGVTTKYIQRLLNDIIEQKNLTIKAKELLERLITVLKESSKEVVSSIIELIEKTFKAANVLIDSSIVGVEVDIGVITNIQKI